MPRTVQEFSELTGVPLFALSVLLHEAKEGEAELE